MRLSVGTPAGVREDETVTLSLPLTLVGGPTLLFTYAGLRFITDPTFDEPGDHGGLIKTAGPAVPVEEVGPVDVALISHDHHPDNLDDAGRAVAHRARLALTTQAGAERDSAFVGLAEGQSVTVTGEVAVTVTAVPAQHGPAHVAPHTGPVIGFILSAEGWPTVYFSGDNSEVDVVEDIAAQHPDVALAILCVGAARVANRGPEPLTLDADRAVAVAGLWPRARIVPVHAEGWAHFSEPREHMVRVLTEAVGHRALILDHGMETAVEV